MCSGRLREYSVVPEGRGRPALLQNYRLCFNKKSDDGSGKANIEEYSGGEMWGVIYTMSEADLRRLDRGEVGYHREKVTVNMPDGVPTEVWVYVANESTKQAKLRPYSWYKRFLVEGAKEHGLPATYVEALQRIDADEDKNVARDSKKRSLACRA